MAKATFNTNIRAQHIDAITPRAMNTRCQHNSFMEPLSQMLVIYWPRWLLGDLITVGNQFDSQCTLICVALVASLQ